jgi:hypothetical protein
MLAWIRIDGRPKLGCHVRGITPAGAFLELTPPSWLPFKFVIEIEHDGTLLGCEIRHTRPTGIGVHFVPVETVTEFAAKSKQSRTQAEEWTANSMQARELPSSKTNGKAGGSSLPARVRATSNSKP